MIKVEKIKVYNIDRAVMSCRNPLSSWKKSDSYYATIELDENGIIKREDDFVVGPKDIALMQRLYKAGPEHAKYLRQIFLCMDITAPLYWWKEMDQYRIGVTTDSTSTMHKLHTRDLTRNDFSCEHLFTKEDKKVIYVKKPNGMLSAISPEEVLDIVIATINAYREEYEKTKDKRCWLNMIQLLPSSYNQMRTITMSYANVMNIISQREHHKLQEWLDLCNILRSLPYVKTIRGEE